jgi:hypothetical protein
MRTEADTCYVKGRFCIYQIWPGFFLLIVIIHTLIRKFVRKHVKTSFLQPKMLKKLVLAF